jgi:hypothetical protein
MEQPHLVVPLPMMSVTGGSVCAVVANCLRPVLPRYLVIPKSIAPYFVIRDIKVGRTSIFHAAKGVVPAEVFGGSVDAVDAREDEATFLQKTELEAPVPMLVDHPDDVITIVVQNIGPVARNFMGVVFAVLPNHNVLATGELSRMLSGG